MRATIRTHRLRPSGAGTAWEHVPRGAMTGRADDPHPLLSVLLAAAGGAFPPMDGRAVLMPPLAGGLQAAVSFTGHAVIATALPAAELAGFAVDGFGAALQPQVLQHLAGPGGHVGVIDVTLVGTGLGAGTLPLRHDLDEHPRVRLARGLRGDVRVFGDERGLVTLACGVAGRTELSVEAAPGNQGQGVGRSLIVEALRLAPDGDAVFAAVSPGNARSLRAFLALGFQPLGSEVLIRRGIGNGHEVTPR